MRRLLLAGLVLSMPAAAQSPATQTPTTFPKATTAPDAASVTVETVATGLDHPWGLAFLPDGRMLVTERPGRLRVIGTDFKLGPPLAGVPEVFAIGQGGLLDVVLDPAFPQNRTIYLSYAEAGEGGAGTAVARAALGETGLSDVQVIYRQLPKVNGGNHFGSRLVFAPDGTLFVTQGDRYAYREQAQDLASGLGKIVRINKDGTIPRDNPFVGQAGARPEIWSYGHRNVQGATLGPDGRLWTAEHGAKGGDELNQPEAGKNYGWPVITYGRDYNGSKIGIGTAKEGMEQPVMYWDPSIAPSGLALYEGAAFPAWRGDFLVGSLSYQHVARVKMEGGRAVAEYRYLEKLDKRIRDVRVGPGGFVYVLTDSNNGWVLRLRPAG